MIRLKVQNEKLKEISSSILWGLLDIVYPPFCQGCDVRLSIKERVVCENCWQKLKPTGLDNWVEDVTHNTNLDAVFSGWFFDELLQKIIYALKYQEMRGIAKVLGNRLSCLFHEEIKPVKIDGVVPVPLHSVRHRERGFNQSELLAKSFAKNSGLAYYDTLLKRTRNTMSQTFFSIEERKSNVMGAFTASQLGNFKRFLLVDDVLTTGATLSACALTLKEKGAEWVGGLTVGTPPIHQIGLLTSYA